MPSTKRAYSEEEKQQREQKIIEAAQELLTEKGYYNINMDEVARTAGLAKGTVYLYFKTKEELFLSVFQRQASAWLNEMESALETVGDHATPEVVVKLLVDSVKDKPQLTRLVALKQILFEHNISFERAHEDKLWLYRRMRELGQLIAEKLSLPADRGLELLERLYLFITGLEGTAHPSPISRQVYETEPNLKTVDFATELGKLLLAVLRSWQT